MSMICYLVGVSASQASALQEQPSLVADMTEVAFDEIWGDAAASPAVQDDSSEIAGLKSRLAPLGPLERTLDLEKSWHILHYLFTGSALPVCGAADVLLTGEPVGGDMGYGPARHHDAKAVQEFSEFLAKQDEAELQRRVDIGKLRLHNIYALPSGRDPETQYEAELKQEVSHYFPLLRDYVSEMVKKEKGLLIWLS